MDRTISRGLRRSSLGLALLALTACSRPESIGSRLAGDGTPSPKPAEPATAQAQLTRYAGQTQFMNIQQSFRGSLQSGHASASSLPGGSVARAIQESDIFKVGKEGSSLLYLLNNYRGLQVVSFAEGPENPKLLGRVEATGNFPDGMYYDAAHDQLIVLERNWYDQNGGYNRSTESRIVFYDVADPANPAITKTITIEGELAESRIVGDVLYLATTVWPSYWEWNSGKTKGKGSISSYKLERGGATKVAKHDLDQPVSSRENMNIIEVEKDGARQYYLVGILAEQSWWDRQSEVEIVDISSPKGTIKPVMRVATKGIVKERSSTHVKDDTLIVASNYRIDGANGAQALRVAVETFTFPTAGAKVIDTDEAKYRQLHIERALKNMPAGKTKEAYRAELEGDTELGLKNVFVRDGEHSLRKIIADSTVTTGDTTGLSADVRDVRFHGDYLYVFWVPTNLVDPLDVFDASNPRSGISHLKRELFEGWIDHAMPIAYQGREFILGLGWIVPDANNETGRRIPQAALFEVTKRGKSARIDTVAQYDLEASNVYVDFNRGDKYVETKLRADGRGVVLFQISSWADKYVSGGKLIGFDLNKAIEGSDDEVFTEGALLKANADWLRRVFTNPEIDRINTFSDRSLGVYGADEKKLGATNDVFEAVAVLELARNIEAYATLKAGDATFGVQFVEKHGGYASWLGSPGEVELRLVPTERADTEQPAVVSSVTLEGSYLAHLVDQSDGSLLVATSQSREAKTETTGEARHELVITVSRLAVTGAKLDKSGQVSWVREAPNWRGAKGHSPMIMPYPSNYASLTLTQLASGRIVASEYDGLRDVVPTKNGLTAAELTLSGSCGPDKKEGYDLVTLGGHLFATYHETFAHPDERVKNLELVKHYLAPVKEEASGFTCQTAINIPGRAIGLYDGRHIVTEDQRLLDIKEQRQEWTNQKGEKEVSTYFQPVTARVIDSLAVKGKEAVLKDMYEPEVSEDAMHALESHQFVFVENAASGYNAYPLFSVLGFDTDLSFVKTSFALDRGEPAGRVDTRLISVVKDPAVSGGYLGVLARARRAQVIAWHDTALRPEVVRVQEVGTDLAKKAETSDFLLKGYYGYSYFGGAMSKVHFTPSLKSFEFAQGLYGVKQVYVAD